MRSLCFYGEVMEHKAKPTGRPSDFYVIGLVLTGAIFWALTLFQESFIALYQLLAIVFFGAAIYLLIRYRLTVFCLRIEGRNGASADIHTAMAEELDFVVEKIRGKGRVPLARLSLDQLDRVDVIPYSDLKKLPGVASLYRYQADMSPEEGTLMIFKNEDRDIAIFTDLSPEMMKFLKKTVSYNFSGDGK